MKIKKTLGGMQKVLLTILLTLVVVDIEQGFKDQGICFPGQPTDYSQGPGSLKFYACNYQDKVWVETRLKEMPKRFIFNSRETLDLIMREKNSL